MSTTTLTTSRDPRGQEFMRIVAAVYDNAGLDAQRAERLNQESTYLVERLCRMIDRCAIDGFWGEETGNVPHTLHFYTKPQPIGQQLEILRNLFPGLGSVDETLATHEIPVGAEGYVALPRWEAIAPTYGEAVQRLFDVFQQNCGGEFWNYLKGRMGPQYLQQQDRTVGMLQRLADWQRGHDILVVPVQLGLRHISRSIRRFREVMLPNEFGLGAFSGSILLLTHPEWLNDPRCLEMFLAGDDFAEHADRTYDHAPCLNYHDESVNFGTIANHFYPCENRTCVPSAFLPHDIVIS